MSDLEQRAISEIPNSEKAVLSLIYHYVKIDDSQLRFERDTGGDEEIISFLRSISEMTIREKYLVSASVPCIGREFHAYDFSEKNGLLPVKMHYRKHRSKIRRSKSQVIVDDGSFGSVYWFAVEND